MLTDKAQLVIRTPYALSPIAYRKYAAYIETNSHLLRRLASRNVGAITTPNTPHIRAPIFRELSTSCEYVVTLFKE